MTSLLFNPKSPPSLLNKRTWKPSSIELAVLQNHFARGNSPSNKDKDQLLMKLKSTLGTDCTSIQLNDWFQTKRNDTLKRIKTEEIKSSYLKFSATELKSLAESFELTNYPENKEMKSMADDFGVKISKIENWYKHHRRLLAKKGEFDLKTKKYFNRKEVHYLMSGFQQNSRPSSEEIFVIAKEINCSELQIKNWFSNKRKKFRSFDRDQIYEALTSSEKIEYLPQSSSSDEEAFSPLLPTSTTCFHTNFLTSEPQKEPENLWSIETSNLPKNHETIVREAPSHQQPALIDFGSSLYSASSIRAPQEFHTELRRGAADPQQLLFQQAPLSNQTSYFVLVQNPVRSNIYQSISPMTYQFHPSFPQGGSSSFQNLNNHASLLLDAQRATIQALFINNQLVNNPLVQHPQSQFLFRGNFN